MQGGGTVGDLRNERQFRIKKTGGGKGGEIFLRPQGKEKKGMDGKIKIHRHD